VLAIKNVATAHPSASATSSIVVPQLLAHEEERRLSIAPGPTDLEAAEPERGPSPYRPVRARKRRAEALNTGVIDYSRHKVGQRFAALLWRLKFVPYNYDDDAEQGGPIFFNDSHRSELS
jgi:hypothetical protein